MEDYTVTELVTLLADAGLGDGYARRYVYEVLAEVWEEGVYAATNGKWEPETPNPYREEN